jgi:hypothetical protein
MSIGDAIRCQNPAVACWQMLPEKGVRSHFRAFGTAEKGSDPFFAYRAKTSTMPTPVTPPTPLTTAV